MKTSKKITTGSELSTITDECIRQIAGGLQALDWTNPDVYAAWLSQTFAYTRYTTRFVAFAAGRCSLEQEKFFSQLSHGLADEKGHELLAVRDLEALGRDISEFPECPQTAAYHQSIFRNVDAHGAVAILGYSVPLEGTAATAIGAILRTVVKKYGEAGTHFLRAHSELDEGHFRDALSSLTALSPEEIAIVAHHMELSTGLYLGIVGAVPALAKQTSKTSRKAS